MPKYIKDKKTGQLKGSIGEGGKKHNIPTPSEVSVAFTEEPSTSNPNYGSLHTTYNKLITQPSLFGENETSGGSVGVVAGEVKDRTKKLSPSSANTFRRCPKLFHYTQVLGEKTPATVAILKGDLAHKVLEDLWRRPVAERTPEKAQELVDHYWADMKTKPKAQQVLSSDKVNNDDSEIVSHTKEMVENYFTLEKTDGNTKVTLPNNVEIDGQEFHVEGEVKGASFHGFIDRFDQIKDPETGETKLRITDYKTGKLPTKDSYLDDYWFQQMTYASLLREQYGVSVDKVRLVYLQGGVYEKKVTAERIDAHDEALSNVYAEVQEAKKNDNWPGKPEYLCNWCHFKDRCEDFQNSKVKKL
jgi:putative RecB family exonuclease